MWMMNNQTEPYNSFGNGSAMRVSPVRWFASSLEECETVADFLWFMSFFCLMAYAIMQLMQNIYCN